MPKEPAPPPPPCPSCGQNEAAVVFATRTSVYLLCRACEHTWAIPAPSGLETPDPSTSPAFRRSNTPKRRSTD